jgi:hypothetical protein
VSWLFGFLLALYLLTSGGHTSSNDEEVMYYVTQGIVERGSLTLPPREGAALSCDEHGLCPTRQMADGTYYGVYGPVQSLLAIPFYLAGSEFANLFEPRFQEFIKRFAVTGLGATATAWSAAMVSLLAVELGASARGGIALGLLFGTTTLAWAYAHYFWSEPTATAILATGVLLAIRAARGQSAWLWAAAGSFLGLVVATRLAMVAVVPPVFAYLVIASARPRRGWTRRLFALCLGLLGPAVLIGSYNFVRYHSIMETGYGFVPGASFTPDHFDVGRFGGDLLAAVHGLFLSPGKSVFLYSPPLVVAVLAAPALWRRAPREAALFGALILSQILVLAAYGRWFGESAWGPRYLVPLLPFLLLPLATWLRASPKPTAGRLRLVSVTAGLGLAVQFFAVTTNYDTYILQTGGPDGPGAERRWFDPSASPLLAAPAQFRARLVAYMSPLQPGQFAFVEGFFVPDSEAPLPRWTTAHAVVDFVPQETGGGRVQMSFVQPDGGAYRAAPALDIMLDGVPMTIGPAQIIQNPPGNFTIELALPVLEPGRHRLVLDSPTFEPAEVDGGTDFRRLGIQLTNLTFNIDSGLLSNVDYPVVPPLPVSDQESWSRAAFGWFYDSRIPHLVDMWPWYVAFSGLPRWPLALLLVPAVASVWCGAQLARYLLAEPCRPTLRTRDGGP